MHLLLSANASQDLSATPAKAAAVIRVCAVLSPLSYALDLTEGRPMGHSVRACIIGMRIAKHIGMPIAEQADLFYALLLKDAGCSSNSSKLFHILAADEIRAKRNVKLTDWTKVGWDSLQYAIRHVATGKPFLERMQTLFRVAAKQQTESRELVQIRCERGAAIARRMGLPDAVAQAIYSLDEHWNGVGYPEKLVGAQIPIFSRIMNLAQTLEVFEVCRGQKAALEVAMVRSKRWFDPDLVKAVKSLSLQGTLWQGLDKEVVLEDVLALEPIERHLMADDATLDGICDAFAEIIDNKSPFTFRHSTGVAAAAVAMSRQLGFDELDVTFMRRAALLHDLGKLAVSNEILEKPGNLDAGEWEIIKTHPFYSYEILRNIPTFSELAEVAASHHEKLDGSGYFRGYTAEQMPLKSRILAVADIYDALVADRPYREGMPLEKVFAILEKDAPRALDPVCVEALRTACGLGSLGKALSS